jgi:hypothetical protein
MAGLLVQMLIQVVCLDLKMTLVVVFLCQNRISSFMSAGYQKTCGTGHIVFSTASKRISIRNF